MNENPIPVMPPYSDDYVWAARKAERKRRLRMRRIRNRAAILLLAALTVTAATHSCGKQDNAVTAAEPTLAPQTITINTVTFNTYPVAEDTLHPQEETTAAPNIGDFDEETQRRILNEVCGGDTSKFCALMAIAYSESRFEVYKIGDGGDSYGAFQINLPAQADRITALGYSFEDMFDPVKAAAVALDYLEWIMAECETEDVGTHEVFMSYNMGWRGAHNAMATGITETGYSTEVLNSYREYTAMLEGTP